MVNKIFHCHIKKFQIIPKSGIYDEYSKERISKFNRHDATLYFIVKTSKIKIIPSSFKVTANFMIKGKFSIDGKEVDIQFDATRIHYDDPIIKNQFKSIKDIIDFFKYCSHPSIKGGINDVSDKYIVNTTIDVENSSENYINIDCALGRTLPNGNKGRIILTPYQLINFFNINCLADLEILYIGKSNDDTWKRVYNHNKWGIIEEHREAHDELIIYFLELDKSFINILYTEGTTYIHRDESDLSIKDATTTTEVALIEYFIKEKKFNINHVGGDITNTDIVRNILKPKGFNAIAIELSLDGLFGFLGSHARETSDYHKIQIKI